MNTYRWYAKLIKPSWAPPNWLFGPVWTALYLIIAVSYLAVLYQAYIGTFSWMIALPFILNLIVNFAFSPIQFRLQSNVLAAFDILLVVGTLVWALVAIWSTSASFHWIAYINIPYLLWGTFATCLQFTITYLNW